MICVTEGRTAVELVQCMQWFDTWTKIYVQYNTSSTHHLNSYYSKKVNARLFNKVYPATALEYFLNPSEENLERATKEMKRTTKR